MLYYLSSHLSSSWGPFRLLASHAFLLAFGTVSAALAVVLLREFAVSGLRLIAVEQGQVIAAAWSGKVKTFATMVCICFMLVFDWPWLNILCQIVILGTTVYSGIEYFVKNKAVFKA